MAATKSKPTAPKHPMLSPSEVAARLAGPSARAIQRWCEKGLVEHRKYPSGQIFIPLSGVERIERESHQPRVKSALPESSRIGVAGVANV